MIQMQSNLEVADNSGAKTVRCIKVLGGTNRVSAKVGDIVVVAVQQVLVGGKMKKGEIKKGVIVRTKYPLYREDGSSVTFDDNAVVLIGTGNDPLGTRIFGPVARELRSKKFTKICSLAPEVL